MEWVQITLVMQNGKRHSYLVPKQSLDEIARYLVFAKRRQNAFLIPSKYKENLLVRWKDIAWIEVDVFPDQVQYAPKMERSMKG